MFEEPMKFCLKAKKKKNVLTIFCWFLATMILSTLSRFQQRLFITFCFSSVGIFFFFKEKKLELPEIGSHS